MGTDFQARRLRLNMTQEQLAVEAGIKSRDTVGAIEAGKGSPSTRRKLEDALTRLEGEGTLPPLDEAAAPTADSPAGPIRFTFHDVFGVGEIIVEGPADKPDELVAAVGKLLEEVRRREG